MKPFDQTHWSSPDDIRKQLIRRWERGDLLAGEITGDPIFPLRLNIKGPPSGQLAKHFDAVRSWIAVWQQESDLKLEWRNVSPKLLGNNSIPSTAVLETIENAAVFIGKKSELEHFRKILETTRNHHVSELKDWILRRPTQTIALAKDWKRLLDIVAWLKASPKPEIYLRQIDVPGVHSKFVESRRQVLSEMLDMVLPSQAIDASATGVNGFNRRYGFRDKPERVRFRFLDRTKAIDGERLGLDLTIDADRFALLNPDITRVFITENVINFLSFPDVDSSIVLFGSGYGFDFINKAKWLNKCRIQYWGDIDTHGFAILDQLRSHFSHVESLLMDHETLKAFREFWGVESTPIQRELHHLTILEKALYDDIRHNRFVDKLRLEQEHVSLSWLEQRLKASS